MIVARKQVCGEIHKVLRADGTKWYEYTDPLSGDNLQFSTLRTAWLLYREIVPADGWRKGWDARILHKNRSLARRYFRRFLRRQGASLEVA
jgi:hypothetical protein